MKKQSNQRCQIRLDRLGIAGDEIQVLRTVKGFTTAKAKRTRPARFGKSRRRTNRGGPGTLRFGSRGSSKLIRCYWKEEIGRYRVELELHATLLKKFSIQKITELPLIVTKLWPAHFCFKVMRW